MSITGSRKFANVHSLPASVTDHDLRALALAATRGPWREGEHPHEIVGDGGETVVVSPSHAEDLCYIIAANPARVLRLLDRIADLERRTQ